MSKPHAACSLLLALLIGLTRPSPCASSLYNPPPPDMAYHHGGVLDGTVPVSVLYYGAFSPHHKAVLADFLLSLSPRSRPHAFGAPAAASSASVAQWPMLGLRHWVATVLEDEDGEAGCRGIALAAAGEGGKEGRLPWPWPWP
ncbi:hypothetical protein TRIUR3_08145 [Triticum urartu]|uniref:Uncharacterized protein n=1 Tax=Triticum urartu TaxID=4572 RepID=M7ZZA3_TRIUA|nr:hypothetical protein TRIUR3_08145 [Triticum urartu]